MNYFVENSNNETGKQEGDTFGSTVRVYLDELESLRLLSTIFFQFFQK